MTNAADADRVWSMAEKIGVCMLTSKSGGGLKARPMHAMPDRNAGEIVFFTDARAHTDDEIAAEPEVCLAFAKPDDNAYLSITGSATVHADREAVRAHWNDTAKTWFPDGPDDPNIRILTVTPSGAEFWDGKSNPIAVAFEIAKARAKGERPDMGEKKKVALG
jgi:general stress protein 26